MLLALVLAACVAPAAHEWVEISQQHYRKPSQTHAYPAGGTFHSADEEPNDDLRHTFYPANEDTTRIHDAHIVYRQDQRNPIYEEEKNKQNIPDRVNLNHYISEHKLNNDRGGIKRVDGNAKLRPNITPEFSLEIYGQVTESEPEQATINYSNRLKDKDIFTATIERVPNKGSVTRVQLSNTHVKAPSVTSAMNAIRRNDIRPHELTVVDKDFSDEFDIKADIFKNAEDAVTPKIHVKNLFSTTKGSPMWKYDIMETSTSESTSTFQKYPPTHPFDNIKKVNNYERHSENISKDKNLSIVEKKLYSNEHINDAAFNTKPKERNKERIKEEKPKNDETKKLEDINLEEVTTSTDPKINNDKNALFPKSHKTKPNIETSSKGEKHKNEENKVNTMENIMKFVKVVADTISKNTKRDVNGKVKYLNELKETLLSSIQERIEATWPDDTARRRSRSARGHVEFPSSESSLMTISFLTFAVFLIKLVLQVITTYKNKGMMVAPVMVATAGRTISNLRNFH